MSENTVSSKGCDTTLTTLRSAHPSWRPSLAPPKSHDLIHHRSQRESHNLIHNPWRTARGPVTRFHHPTTTHFM